MMTVLLVEGWRCWRTPVFATDVYEESAVEMHRFTVSDTVTPRHSHDLLHYLPLTSPI